MFKTGIQKQQSHRCMLFGKRCCNNVIMMLFQCISFDSSSIRQTCCCDVHPMLLKRNSNILDSFLSGLVYYSAC